jgi:hypothetical protein
MSTASFHALATRAELRSPTTHTELHRRHDAAQHDGANEGNRRARAQEARAFNGRAYRSTDTIPMRVGETLKVRFIGSQSRAVFIGKWLVDDQYGLIPRERRATLDR